MTHTAAEAETVDEIPEVRFSSSNLIGLSGRKGSWLWQLAGAARCLCSAAGGLRLTQPCAMRAARAYSSSLMKRPTTAYACCITEGLAGLCCVTPHPYAAVQHPAVGSTPLLRPRCALAPHLPPDPSRGAQARAAPHHSAAEVPQGLCPAGEASRCAAAGSGYTRLGRRRLVHRAACHYLEPRHDHGTAVKLLRA
jgi:hypothetical protein